MIAKPNSMGFQLLVDDPLATVGKKKYIRGIISVLPLIAINTGVKPKIIYNLNLTCHYGNDKYYLKYNNIVDNLGVGKNDGHELPKSIDWKRPLVVPSNSSIIFFIKFIHSFSPHILYKDFNGANNISFTIDVVHTGKIKFDGGNNIKLIFPESTNFKNSPYVVYEAQ